MGYVSVIAPCFGCGKIFSFNPVRVPSIVVEGRREPVCLTCVERTNPRRVAAGLAPFVPLPGAYEACDESEIP